MEERGWHSIEEDVVIPNDVWYASSSVAWSQQPAASCMEKKQEWMIEDQWWGPRIHTIDGRANFHSYMIAGPIETYVPWSWGSDPHDKVILWRTCR